MEVWFNPSCSKCRAARERLDEAGVDYTLRRYLDDPPTEEELRAALTALGLQPWDITRTSDPLAREVGVADLPRDPDAWIRLLVEHPRLLQRPLVLTDDGRAWVARRGSGRRSRTAREPASASSQPPPRGDRAYGLTMGVRRRSTWVGVVTEAAPLTTGTT